ncbi:MAG TPA: MmcQ/YjbR family DNA-binding protein [Saprospiraceae bacterium]|nr:MmcQ/YjbR family DNA-binding protein [Saprospiraceae bacterium]
MISIEVFRKLALSFAEVEELPHFEKTSFRVRKKIFSTLDTQHNRACMKLTEIDQSIYCAIDPAMIHMVPNKWGKQGWTFVELGKVNKEILTDILTTAYCTVAPKALVSKYEEDDLA